MTTTRRIGLSLGADICWPLCFEKILSRLDLTIDEGGETMRFETERVTIEPFDLRQPCRYDVVLDRLTHWYHTSREWIKKAILLDGLYVLNNPWAVQSMEKQTTYCAMMRLGLAIPDTWMIPPKEYDDTPDLQPTLERYAKMFDLGAIGERLGYPMFMKPYDGGGWVGVHRLQDEQALRDAYEQSGTKVMHLQKAVEGWDLFVRCVGLGPQVRLVRYDPGASLHGRYTMDTDFVNDQERARLRRITLTINSFFGWDFNSCEVLRAGGVLHPIDFANPCPDSQVTSLHYHFPWLVKANLRWAIYCAAVRRPCTMNLRWAPYFAIADGQDDPEARLRAYGELAEAHFDTERFEAFCHRHLGALDEVAYAFFDTGEAKDAIRRKVASLYPAHEVDDFTDLFWDRIQRWRAEEGHAPLTL